MSVQGQAPVFSKGLFHAGCCYRFCCVAQSLSRQQAWTAAHLMAASSYKSSHFSGIGIRSVSEHWTQRQVTSLQCQPQSTGKFRSPPSWRELAAIISGSDQPARQKWPTVGTITHRPFTVILLPCTPHIKACNLRAARIQATASKMCWMTSIAKQRA